MIPKVLNPGNAVPVYPRIEWQMRYQCGCIEFNWAIPVKRNNVLEIQVPIVIPDSGPGPIIPDALFGWAYKIWGEDGTEYTSGPTTTGLSVASTTDGYKAWLTLKGYGSEIPADCDTFYISFGNAAVLRSDWYSELFRFYDFGDKSKIYKLTFYNDTDVDGTLYQVNFVQTLWLFDAVWDVPGIVEVNDNITDGDAVEVPTFQSIQRRAVLKFPYFPDFWQGVFHRLKMHSSVVLTKEETNEEIEINGKNIQFTVEEQDVCFTKGVLSWIESTQIMTTCGDNYELIG